MSNQLSKGTKMTRSDVQQEVEHKPSQLNRFLLPILGASVAVLLVVGLVLLSNRISDLKSTISVVKSDLGTLSEKVEQTSEHMRAAVQAIEDSRRLTEAAAEDARLAADQRRRAESARTEAVAKALRAEREADEARLRTAEATEKANAARLEAERIRRERDADLDRLQGALSQIAETRRTALGLVMNLGSDSMQFDFNKSELRPENRELLSRIAGILMTSRGYAISVYGHTDDIGSDEYNLRLSERRARAVREYLVEAGVQADSIETQGVGKARPLVASTTPEARARNRRVEIAIIDTKVEYRKQVPD